MTHQYDYTGLPEIKKRNGMRVVEFAYWRGTSGAVVELISNAYGNGYYNEFNNPLEQLTLDAIKKRAKELELSYETP
jgi:hypothetical protein